MEPLGTLDLFRRSLQKRLRYKWLIADGDSKTHNLLLDKQPYGSQHAGSHEKGLYRTCTKKRLGTAFVN